MVVVAIDHSSQAEHAFKCEYHTILLHCNTHWLIQDFPEGGANSQSGCANLLFCN